MTSFRKVIVLDIDLLRRKVDMMGKIFSSSFVRDCIYRILLELTIAKYVIFLGDAKMVE